MDELSPEDLVAKRASSQAMAASNGNNETTTTDATTKIRKTASSPTRPRSGETGSAGKLRVSSRRTNTSTTTNNTTISNEAEEDRKVRATSKRQAPIRPTAPIRETVSMPGAERVAGIDGNPDASNDFSIQSSVKLPEQDVEDTPGPATAQTYEISAHLVDEQAELRRLQTILMEQTTSVDATAIPVAVKDDDDADEADDSWSRRCMLMMVVIIVAVAAVIATVVVVVAGGDDVPDELVIPEHCFTTTLDLRRAVLGYVQDNRSDTEVAEQFGHPINEWCVGFVQDFSFLFSPELNNITRTFNEPLDKWDMSSATDISSMFRGNVAFNQDISSWDVSKVVNFNALFRETAVFNQDLSRWNLTSAEKAEWVFGNARQFNQNLCSWGDTLAPSVSTKNMFLNTTCEVRDDPILNVTPPGPFCNVCSS